MSVADIFLTLLGIGLIGFAFLFAWSMCMIAKADEDLREFIQTAVKPLASARGYKPVPWDTREFTLGENV